MREIIPVFAVLGFWLASGCREKVDQVGRFELLSFKEQADSILAIDPFLRQSVILDAAIEMKPINYNLIDLSANQPKDRFISLQKGISTFVRGKNQQVLIKEMVFRRRCGGNLGRDDSVKSYNLIVQKNGEDPFAVDISRCNDYPSLGWW